jgi:uncharacterized damage-inducible protein DinB
MDQQNEFYKYEMDNLLNELISQINSNRQIYERVKEEEFDKKIHEKINSIRENVRHQIKTHHQYLVGLESGTINFSAQVEEASSDLKKDQLILKLVEVDKKIINAMRNIDILQKLFTVPWRTEQVKVHEVLRSMLLHESYFIGRNSVLVDFLGVNSLKDASTNWAAEQNPAV